MKKFGKLLASVMAVSMLTVTGVSLGASAEQAPPFVGYTIQENTLRAVAEADVGDLVSVNSAVGIVVDKNIVLQTEDEVFEVSLIKLNPYSRSVTSEYTAIGTHHYTGTTHYAYLYGSFSYGNGPVNVHSRSHSFSKSSIFSGGSYTETENIFTKTKTLKLSYSNLTALGWDGYTISMKCTTSGDVSVDGLVTG